MRREYICLLEPRSSQAAKQQATEGRQQAPNHMGVGPNGRVSPGEPISAIVSMMLCLLQVATPRAVLGLLLLSGTWVSAQQGPSDLQGQQHIHQALATLTNGARVKDVTLTGTAEWTLGSTHETGAATMKVKSGAGARVDLALGGESRSEVRYETAGKPAGLWVDKDGTAHAVALHNALSPAAWFLPSAFLATTEHGDSSFIWVGTEQREGTAVDHIQIYRTLPAQDARTAALLQQLSAIDVYLDSSSHLPLALAFNLHPQTNATQNIAAEIRFTDYRPVNGMLVPFHIQRFIQGSINLEITLTDVILNSGIPDSDFGLH